MAESRNLNINTNIAIPLISLRRSSADLREEIEKELENHTYCGQGVDSPIVTIDRSVEGDMASNR